MQIPYIPKFTITTLNEMLPTGNVTSLQIAI